MRLFDIFKNHKDRQEPINRKDIPAAEIDRAQRIQASEKYRKIIYRRYYSDYPEMPYISLDRELYTNWMKQTEIFPSGSLVSKEMMTRYSDGLLPGHIYMLYWLCKHKKGRIPSYFEYDYGIDFVREKQFLLDNGYLNADSKPSEKGTKAIKLHIDVIKQRHPSPVYSEKDVDSPPKQGIVQRRIVCTENLESVAVPETDKALLATEFEYINSIVKYACNLAHIRSELSVDTTKFFYGLEPLQTHYTQTPFTPSGKKSKYPLTLHYAYKNSGDIDATRDRFGEIYYLQNGAIGKARLIFWNGQKKGYFIYLGQTQNTLVVKKVESSDTQRPNLLYKE